jgi:hypothetical protein
VTRYPALSGLTLVVPIIGDPIGQVKSPDGITKEFATRNRNAVSRIGQYRPPQHGWHLAR